MAGVPDTNPYGLLVTGTGFVVADAGANALFDVTLAGDTSTLSVFPPQTESPAVRTSSVPGGSHHCHLGPR
jgi:hypothetical protein